MEFIVFDLEATCWEGDFPQEKMEIIEIGAVRLRGPEFKPYSEFSLVVRPVENPELSRYCTRLTNITQKEVDQAPTFPEALKRFIKWAGDGPIRFCSWSDYDRLQLERDCGRHGVEFPEVLTGHIDLRALFSRHFNIEDCPMTQALEVLRLSLDGPQHRALADTRNIVKIAREILPFRDVSARDHIEIVPYNPGWPESFKKEKQSLQSVLSANGRVEHVGSTSVPGTPAKSTLDILVGLPDDKGPSRADIAALKRLNYRYLGEYGIAGRHFFRKGVPPTHHLHWVQQGSEFWSTQILFRDYLRSHPDESKRYAEFKKELAKRFSKNRREYTRSKTEFVEAINKKARLWAGPDSGS